MIPDNAAVQTDGHFLSQIVRLEVDVIAGDFEYSFKIRKILSVCGVKGSEFSIRHSILDRAGTIEFISEPISVRDLQRRAFCDGDVPVKRVFAGQRIDSFGDRDVRQKCVAGQTGDRCCEQSRKVFSVFLHGF